MRTLCLLLPLHLLEGAPGLAPAVGLEEHVHLHALDGLDELRVVDLAALDADLVHVLAEEFFQFLLHYVTAVPEVVICIHADREHNENEIDMRTRMHVCSVYIDKIKNLLRACT